MAGNRCQAIRVWTPVACLVFFLLAPLQAINLQLTSGDIERALVIARQRDQERARFHAPYILNLNTPTVQSVEIVSPFRRVVLLAEERITKGDRAFAYSTRLAEDAVKTWTNRVSVLARLRFHPLNTYVSVPDIEIRLGGPGADQALIGVLKEPQYGFTAKPDEQAALVGATAEGVFDAALVGQSERTVSVRVDGKEVAFARVDFRTIE